MRKKVYYFKADHLVPSQIGFSATGCNLGQCLGLDICAGIISHSGIKNDY